MVGVACERTEPLLTHQLAEETTGVLISLSLLILRGLLADLLTLVGVGRSGLITLVAFGNGLVGLLAFVCPRAWIGVENLHHHWLETARCRKRPLSGLLVGY